MSVPVVILVVAAQTLPGIALDEPRVGHLNVIWVDALDRGESELRVYLTVDKDTVIHLVPAEGFQFDFDALRRWTSRVVVASGSPSTRVLPNGQRSTDVETTSLRLKDGRGEDAVRPLDVR